MTYSARWRTKIAPLGLTRQAVIAIEQGRYSRSLEMAFRIARVFGVPPEDVFRYPDREVEGG